MIEGDVAGAIKYYKSGRTAGEAVSPAEITRRIESEKDILARGGADMSLIPFVIEAVER